MEYVIRRATWNDRLLIVDDVFDGGNGFCRKAS